MRCFFRIETGDFAGAREDLEHAVAMLEQLPDAQPDRDLESLRMQLLGARFED